MAAQTTMEMTFRRDIYSSRACLEYSWVPEGKRRTIFLDVGQQVGSSNDQVSDTLHPSHVQVYSLSNNEQWSTEGWQFPEGPPQGTDVVRATVEISQTNHKVVGTVYYAGGTSASYSVPLDEVARPCPEGNATIPR